MITPVRRATEQEVAVGAVEAEAEVQGMVEGDEVHEVQVGSHTGGQPGVTRYSSTQQ